jgi:hypothetical protein
MKVLFHPASNMVDLSSDPAGLADLAALFSTGAGMRSSEDGASSNGEVALTRLIARTTTGRILITADEHTRTLTFAGSAQHLNTLAEIVHETAVAADGGHVHIEHYPDHPYLAQGSTPVVLNHPLGGMPLTR